MGSKVKQRVGTTGQIKPMTCTPEWQAKAFITIARKNDPADDTELVTRLAKAFALADSQPALLAACEDMTAICEGVAPDHSLAIKRARAAIAAARPEANDAN